METLEFRIKRKYFGSSYTIGQLYVNTKLLCDTLEDTNRDLNHDGDLLDKGENKIYGKTCIPFGRYEIELYKSPKFRRFLPKLKDVKHFEYILIHAGNTSTDTEGCILPGENKKKGMVLNSRKYEDIIVRYCQNAIADKKKIFITIE